MRRMTALLLLVAVAQFASLGCRSSKMVGGKCDCGEFPGESVQVIGKSSAISSSSSMAAPVHVAPSPLPAAAPAQLPQGY
ncbi:hypothetical protein [Tuwongella immobilis]|uniref:Uncharacterized protein n=1 Tax=Tuwongella immobilis TaxID=692036 RepID=A0A6C2YTN1_9BACT|nr:hypothetical protein [Tuwongella immobilis]VIP04836.1 unnamed protein product [Tuwongella immobilis]VTS07032.1 unnamed protein product [Tuwongella immobilis]